jgi:hypothetical protein
MKGERGILTEDLLLPSLAFYCDNLYMCTATNNRRINWGVLMNYLYSRFLIFKTENSSGIITVFRRSDYHKFEV